MARSPIRGLDPISESGGGSAGAPAEASSVEVETAARESAPPADALSQDKPAEDKASASDGAEPAAAAPTPGGRPPLKKPLGLSLRKPMVDAKAASAAAATATSAPTSTPAPPAPPPAPVRKTSIEEAIELALASASTAVDSAQEIQRLRNELEKVAKAKRRTDLTLFAATVLVVVAVGLGLSGALVYYTRSYDEFVPVARVNRDALLTFAGEVRGLVENGKTIEDAVKISEAAISVATAQTEEIRKAIEGFTAAQKLLATKIPTTDALEKPLAALKKPLDELATSEAAINARLVDMQQAQAMRKPTVAPPVEAPRVEPPKAAPKPQRPATGNESLIRYP